MCDGWSPLFVLVHAGHIFDLFNHMFCLQCAVSMPYLGHIMVVVVATLHGNHIYPLDVTLSVLFSFGGSNLSIQPLVIVHAGELEKNCKK